MCQRPSDIVFVLDMSSSIETSGRGNWKRMLDLVVNIIEKLAISEQGVHVGVVSFSERAQVEFFLNQFFSKNMMTAAVRQIVFRGGNTNTPSGLRYMIDQVFDQTGRDLRGDRTRVANLAIVITDGESNINPGRTIPYANEAKDANIKVLAVGISTQVNQTELRGISSNGVKGETVFFSEDFDVTDQIIMNIVEQSCELVDQGISIKCYGLIFKY